MMNETTTESLAILNAACDLSDERLMSAQLKAIAFIEFIEKKHSPCVGEAYPEDTDRYCSTCMSSDGGANRWPCGTVKKLWELLRPREKGKWSAKRKAKH